MQLFKAVIFIQAIVLHLEQIRRCWMFDSTFSWEELITLNIGSCEGITYHFAMNIAKFLDGPDFFEGESIGGFCVFIGTFLQRCAFVDDNPFSRVDSDWSCGYFAINWDHVDEQTDLDEASGTFLSSYLPRWKGISNSISMDWLIMHSPLRSSWMPLCSTILFSRWEWQYSALGRTKSSRGSALLL